jgi:mannosyltransferase
VTSSSTRAPSRASWLGENSRPQLARAWSLLPVAAATVLAAALRFPTLGEQSYWLDEAVTVDLLRRDLIEMLRAIPSSESTPPLYYLVAWAWANAFGTGEVALRSLSALFGTAMVPVAYGAGVALLSRRVGLIAAGFAATSPLLVWYSQEARAYALVALLSALSFFLFARAVRRPSDGTLLAWAVVSALALASHYFAVFLVAVEAASLFVLTSRRAAAAVAAGGVAIAGLALLPLALYQERQGRTSWIADTPIGDRIQEVVRQFVSGVYSIPHGQKLALLVVGVAIAFLVLRARPDERRPAFLALAVGALTIVLPLALALFGLDYFFYRNLLGAWLPIALFLAIALGAKGAGWAGAAVAGLLVVTSIGVVAATASREDLWRDDWRSVADTLATPGQKLIVVAPTYERVPLEYYRPDVRSIGAGSAATTEILLVGYSVEDEPFPPRGLRIPPTFRQVESRLFDRIRLVRFRAPRAIPLRAADLGSPSATDSRVVLVDRGGTSAIDRGRASADRSRR